MNKRIKEINSAAKGDSGRFTHGRNITRNSERATIYWGSTPYDFLHQQTSYFDGGYFKPASGKDF